MRRLYTVIIYCLTPYFILRLFWLGRKMPSYKARIAERFAYFKAPSQACEIWVHAVSVGEVIAAIPLIKQLQQKFPDKQLVVTTMTPTGSERVSDAFGDSVFHVYLPYDYPGAIKRFINKIQPKTLVIMETELWPNLIHCCAQQSIPVIIANARLSERSHRGYAKVKSLTKGMMANIELILAQGQADANRFVALGADQNRVRTCGNIKFDISIPQEIKTKGHELRQSLGSDRPVWVAASTHEGEEEQILDALHIIKEKYPQSVLILVPRHPQRFDAVAQMCQRNNFKTVLRTENDYGQPLDVLVGDTMGELLVYYAASDVAFVAGSLIPHGGHNVLEPAALEMPLVSGPHVFNFTAINDLLLAENAISHVTDAKHLAATIIQLFEHPQQAQQMGAKAFVVFEKNQGALARQFEMISRVIAR